MNLMAEEYLNATKSYVKMTPLTFSPTLSFHTALQYQMLWECNLLRLTLADSKFPISLVLGHNELNLSLNDLKHRLKMDLEI